MKNQTVESTKASLELSEILLSLSGSFAPIVINFNLSNKKSIDYLVTPCDMAQEIIQSLEHVASESSVLFARCEGTDYCYFPAAGRGAVCTGGLSEWTDCSGMDDLERRWNDYDNSWSK
jgi:hypothetical protein